MSRHRDVRCMNYSDEYEGYDDVYGHSVEDDYCVSPSAEQFLFDRSKQQNIASFITEPDIVEDNEDSEEPVIPSNEDNVALTELEKAKLVSCMESIKNIIGDTVSDSEIRKKIIQSGFDAEAALDLVLKESSPKNVSEPSTNKDSSQHHPDVTPTKPHTSSYIIPKLSFKKPDSIEDNTNMSLTHNLKSFKNLSIGTSPMKFTSLSDLITNHVKTTSNTRESKVNSNTMPFNSLADLTAHHLQNTSSIMNSTNSDRPHSSSTNFVIPKLSIKKDRSNNLNDMTLDTSILQNNRNVKSDLVDDKEKDYSIDSLEKSILNMLALSDDCTNIKRNSYNLQAKEDSLLNVNGTRTPSPDNWMIDLSSALKETTLVASDSSSQTKSNVLKTSKNNISNPNLHITNRDNEVPYICLPTTLNLSSLKNVKLPYTKKNVSLFGRTLCRTWKSRKPALKSQRQQHETVKRFDFSVPYSRNNRT